MSEDKPHTRTYSGTESLPELSANYKPIQIGRNENGDLAPEVRSFVATVRNRSNSDMFIKEGSNSDGILIGPEESYVVTRVDGTSQITLKGDGVGGDYEIRSVEAHNSFGLRDRIEAFVQSISAILRSNRNYTTIEASNATLDTQITGQSVQLDTNIAAANAVLDTKITASDTVLNTAIDGQNITLATDITAQSIDEIGIDIRNQTGDAINERVISSPAEGSFNVTEVNTLSESETVSANSTESFFYEVDMAPTQLARIPQGTIEYDVEVSIDVDYTLRWYATVLIGSSLIWDFGQMESFGQTGPDTRTWEDFEQYTPNGTAYYLDPGETVSVVFELYVENNESTTGTVTIDGPIQHSVNGSEVNVET